MKSHVTTLIGGVVLGAAVLTAGNGLLGAQASPALGGVPPADQAAMLQAATPEATEAQMAGKMEQMMDQCLAMMKMMGIMMGGDMNGMMGGEDIQGMAP